MRGRQFEQAVEKARGPLRSGNRNGPPVTADVTREGNLGPAAPSTQQMT